MPRSPRRNDVNDRLSNLICIVLGVALAAGFAGLCYAFAHWPWWTILAVATLVVLGQIAVSKAAPYLVLTAVIVLVVFWPLPVLAVAAGLGAVGSGSWTINRVRELAADRRSRRTPRPIIRYADNLPS
jgi:hypothetical protein